MFENILSVCKKSPVKRDYFYYNSKDLFKSINTEQNQFSNILVFTGGQTPDPKSVKHFFSNTESFDCIIAADSGLDNLEVFESFYIKKPFNPDFVVGDMDSVSGIKKIDKYKSCRFIKFPEDKDFTDTELALILAKKIAAFDAKITLIGADGGRLDHLIGVWSLLDSSIAPDFWLTCQQVAVRVKKGQSLSILPLNKSDPISFYLLKSANFWDSFFNLPFFSPYIKGEGLEWDCGLFRKTGFSSLSNRIKACSAQNQKPAVIKCLKGSVVVFTMLDTQVNFL